MHRCPSRAPPPLEPNPPTLLRPPCLTEPTLAVRRAQRGWEDPTVRADESHVSRRIQGESWRGPPPRARRTARVGDRCAGASAYARARFPAAPLLAAFLRLFFPPPAVTIGAANAGG